MSGKRGGGPGRTQNYTRAWRRQKRPLSFLPPLHPPSFQIREGGGKRGVVDMTAKAAGPSFLSPFFDSSTKFLTSHPACCSLWVLPPMDVVYISECFLPLFSLPVRVDTKLDSAPPSPLWQKVWKKGMEGARAHNTTQPALSSPPPPVCQPWQRKGNIPAKGFSSDRPGG